MRLILAILTGKLIFLLSRFFKLGGGSAAPGLYALKIDPNLVSKLSSQITTNIIITGTNGKTTTARLLALLLRDNGIKVIRNHTGSNLERGIASSLISAFQPRVVKLDYDVGIWELDEAAFNSVAPKLNPKAILFLNVLRDQLDRYGEVDSVVNKWVKTLGKLPYECKIFINGDDGSLVPLLKASKGDARAFGVKGSKYKGESNKASTIKLDIFADKVKTEGLRGSSFQLTIDHKPSTINLPLPGLYHIYDAVAALTLAYDLNIDLAKVSKSIENFKPAFGRVEKIDQGYIFLIKNPSGATQVLETIAPQLKPEDRLLIALNDNFADGKDVSWIWDVELEKLKVKNEKLKVVCAGTRAYDLAVRLKYAGIEPIKLTIEPSIKEAFEDARKGLKGTLYVLPTYTALMELQGLFAKLGLKKEYWKEI